MHNPIAKPIEVLLVEDNTGDVRLTKEAFKEGRVRLNLSVARDGVEAMAFLRKEETFANTPRPDLVLLDLNLPKKDGREVLREMKNDPQLLRIPVVVQRLRTPTKIFWAPTAFTPIAILLNPLTWTNSSKS